MDSAAKQAQKIDELQAEIIQLNAQLNWFKNQLFGKKSERRIIDSSEQQLFLGQQFSDASKGHSEETQTIAAHKRKKPKKVVADGDGQALFFDESLVPIEEIKIANPEIEGLSEDAYEVVSTKTTHRLAQRPGAYVILKYSRDVVKIKGVDKNDTKLVCVPAPVSVFEKSRADVSFLAGLLIDKFLYHLPLYRQHQRLAGSGIEVSRAWLTQLIHQCGDLLEPIFDAQLDSIRESRVKIIDETPVKAGRKEKGKMRQAYYWPVMGELDEIAFLYFQSREHRHVFEILGADPKGGSVIVSDGYGAYKAYAEKTNTLNAQCWAHTRREFLKAEDEEPQKSETVLGMIRELYANEATIKKRKLQGKAKRFYRLEHSKPLVDTFFAWVDDERASGALLPSSPLSKALNYAHARQLGLEIFLSDPDVPIDTNEMERALRVIPMGRKNWLFNWTEVGAKYVGIFQSLIVTCRMHGIDPYVYLVDVLQRGAVHPAKDIKMLIPRLWKMHFADNPMRSDLDLI
jgi:transposase